MLRLNKNIKFFINYFLGPLLFVVLSYALYKQIIQQPNLDTALQNMWESVTGTSAWRLYAILLLMLLNWGIEARKWQILLRPVEQITFIHAIKATFAGVALAIHTPNRIGEYGGRVLYVKEGYRLQAVSLMIAGSFSQLLVTLLMGCGGLLYLLQILPTVSGNAHFFPDRLWIKVILCIIVITTLSGILVYFRLGGLLRLTGKNTRLARWLKPLLVLNQLSRRDLWNILLFSALRYLVFVVQYMLMLQLMRVDLHLWQACWMIAVMYLVLAIIPTIALAEVGIRGEIGVLLFGLFSTNQLGIVISSLGIWFINLLIPALVGSLLILDIKLFKTNNLN